MPADLVERINLDQLYPDFLERLLALLAEARNEGHDFYAISGFRPYTEQAKLYFQGRTAPGKIVTWARPGNSYHNFGLAADLCYDADILKPNLQPNWRVEAYDILGTLAPRHGLEWAGNWVEHRECPHVQLPIRTPLLTVRGAFEAKGLQAAWDVVKQTASK